MVDWGVYSGHNSPRAEQKDATERAAPSREAHQRPVPNPYMPVPLLAAAGRTAIHCIHFGRGATGERANFLARLASDNRGSYVYVDMNGR